MNPALQNSAFVKNHVLASLPDHALEKIQPFLTRVTLVHGQVLLEPDQLTTHVFFIDHGVVSVIAEPMEGEVGIQVAMIGQEDIVGDPPLGFAPQRACARMVVQTPGAALRATTGNLQRAFEDSAALRSACAAFVRTLMMQIMHTAACSTRRSLVERCAQWLLMTHERVTGDDVHVTHEALSAMLGIGRASVTVAAASLQQAGLIRIGRGRVTVLDRHGLHQLAYGARPLAWAALRCGAEEPHRSGPGPVQPEGRHRSAEANHPTLA